MLLELLAEERIQRFALAIELAGERRLRIQAENKNIEVLSYEATKHASTSPQTSITHPVLERYSRDRKVNTLLQLLEEERKQSFSLVKQLSEIDLRRIGPETKNIKEQETAQAAMHESTTPQNIDIRAQIKNIKEQEAAQAAMHESTTPQNIDTHAGLERIPRERVKRDRSALRSIPLVGSSDTEDPLVTCDAKKKKTQHHTEL